MLNLFKKKEELVTETSTAKEEPVDFTKYYVKPHDKPSREVTEADLPRLMEDAHIMYQLCYSQHGKYFGGFAIAHSQVCSDDPLQFFVMATQEIIINPKIINHTKTYITSLEACLSYENLPQINVDRYNKVTIEYNVLTKDGKISERVVEKIGGKRSLVFQHELQHLGLNGANNYIYEL